MSEYAIILLCAFGLDILLGDPRYPLHPARLIGKTISLLEKFFRKLGLANITGGILLVLLLLSLTVIAFMSLHELLYLIHPWAATALNIFTVYSCIALKDMIKHTKPIIESLKDDNLPAARTSLQNIVGRDTGSLDSAQICRATVESVSESFLDGFFAPLFWYIIAICIMSPLNHNSTCWPSVAILIYRAINTLDSMVGYKNKRYERFGRASAMLDDILNFIPARLSLLFLFASAATCRFNATQGWKTALRDRLKHASPNSAHTESFTAGALNIRLGGPTIYPHGTVDKPWLDGGNSNITVNHINDTCKLVLCSACISTLIPVVILLIL